MYDVTVIGTGAAGVSAVLTLQLHGKKILWLGLPDLSEKIRKAEKIKNYPALSCVSGAEFAAALKKQTEEAGLAITAQTATGVYAMGEYFTVVTEKETFESRAVILATGVESVKDVEGEEAFLGRGVSYCATCDGFLYKGKTVAVVCTSKDKKGEAEYLASLVGKLYFVPLYKGGGLQGENVETVMGMPLKIEGNKRVEKLIFKDKELSVDGVFFLKNSIAPSVLAGGLKTEAGHVSVSRDMSTNLKGLFAAGDCTGRPYQYAKAVGEGNIAAHTAIEYLRLFIASDGN